MRNTEPDRRAGPARLLTLAGLTTLAALLSPGAAAAQVAQGFALERLVQPAPGSSFIAHDDLRWPTALGGAVALSLGYAHAPLSLSDGSGQGQALVVVRHQTLADLAFAVTWDRLRFGLRFSSPVYVAGDSGAAQGRLFSGPSSNLEHDPDALSDLAISADWRLMGDDQSPLRFAASAIAYAPSGDRAGYATDGTWRGLLKLAAAGEAGRVTWAGHLGFHFRPLDDSPTPGSPRGSEVLFGAAVRAPVPVAGLNLSVGPEVFGATALAASFSNEATALEALLGARLETVPFAGGSLRLKLGAGAALHQAFGAPEYRVVLGVELVGSAQAGKE